MVRRWRRAAFRGGLCAVILNFVLLFEYAHLAVKSYHCNASGPRGVLAVLDDGSQLPGRGSLQGSVSGIFYGFFACSVRDHIETYTSSCKRSLEQVLVNCRVSNFALRGFLALLQRCSFALTSTQARQVTVGWRRRGTTSLTCMRSSSTSPSSSRVSFSTPSCLRGGVRFRVHVFTAGC